MKNLLTNKILKSLLIVGVLVGTTILSRSINDYTIKTFIGIIDFVLILNLLVLNNISSIGMKDFVKDIHTLTSKHWGKLIVVFLFVGFVENYKDIKNGFMDGFRDGYYGIKK